VDQQRWAAAHYRVERESTGVMMRKRQRKKATEMAIEHGDPVPESPEDVVRILDRAGEVVFERDWGKNRPDAMAQEAQIVSDLLNLEVGVFRSKYGIPQPEGEPLPVPPPVEAVASPWDDVPWDGSPAPPATDEETAAGSGSAGAS
jgi:hypothetical protein